MISEYFPNGLERYLIGGLLFGLGRGICPGPVLASIFAGAGLHGLWVGRLCKKAA